MTNTKLNAYIRLMRADKPIGTYLLLWPTIWALLIAAQGMPNLHILIVFVLGVFVMRSAGCVINDYADRKVDGAVERTSNRPLVTGEVSEKEALLLFIALITIAFILVLTLNIETIILSVGALALAMVYPFMKRYTHLPQVVLGAAFSWAIPMAFMAIQQQVPWWAWLLYFANLSWTVAYDTQYAMVDRDDDIRIGVKSTAILFGNMDKVAVAIFQLVALGLLVGLGVLLNFTWPFYMSLVGMAGLFLYQYWIIRHRERSACFKAFLNNHYGGMLVAIGLLVHYLI
ncbi:4-hydroxybenzoate octaprenyltransferase [Aliiglaciecola sp. LCG003]|uniref:4-hydroxybenzoate octaprenyltransferase n=1 Tax=Aliiglaciecola sp. LCG003 TaxID=3053655 RepID=UPI0025734820|nr:4-hydroxybenzoate octaprenyltransferase [Aliiglaciecola sp. LCG003]WJG09525.1 4-hydroxybenzoate octaprenyltransferase [Aliiglaciecola sp. LCG003]